MKVEIPLTKPIQTKLIKFEFLTVLKKFKDEIKMCYIKKFYG